MTRPRNDLVATAARRWSLLRLIYWLFCAAVLAFLLVPIAAIVPLSFSSGSFLTYPLPGLSLRWYHEVLGGGRWMKALGNSLFVGVAATALSVLLGTLAALGLARQRGAWAGALQSQTSGHRGSGSAGPLVAPPRGGAAEGRYGGGS